MRKQGLVAVVAVSLATAGLFGVLLHGQSATADMPAYKVVEVSIDNAAQLEKLLNEQAAGGWHLHSDIDKMFIFERR